MLTGSQHDDVEVLGERRVLLVGRRGLLRRGLRRRGLRGRGKGIRCCARGTIARLGAENRCERLSEENAAGGAAPAG